MSGKHTSSQEPLHPPPSPHGSRFLGWQEKYVPLGWHPAKDQIRAAVSESVLKGECRAVPCVCLLYGWSEVPVHRNQLCLLAGEPTSKIIRSQIKPCAHRATSSDFYSSVTVTRAAVFQWLLQQCNINLHRALQYRLPQLCSIDLWSVVTFTYIGELWITWIIYNVTAV